MCGPFKRNAELARTLVFLDGRSKRLLEKIASLGLSGDSLLLLCRDENTYLACRGTPYPVFFLPDLLSPEDVDNTDRQCLDFIKATFCPGQAEKDPFFYKGVRMGYVIEHYLVPIFMRVYRDTLLVLKAQGHFEHDRIIVAGPGDFSEAARAALSARGIGFESWSGGRLERLFYVTRRFLEGRKSLWRAMPARDLLFEPLQDLLVLLERKPAPAENAFSGKWLFFSAEQHTMDIYEEMARRPGWGFMKCGTYLRMRRTRLGKISPLEGGFRPWMAMAFLAGFLHFSGVWSVLCRDKSFRGGFRFREVDFWPRVRRLVKCHVLISMPVLALVLRAAARGFSLHPGGLLLIGADQPPYYRALVFSARQSGVKSMVIQHGMQAGINGHRAIDADFYAGWGQRTVDWFKKNGLNDAAGKVRVTGAPRYDRYSRMEKTDRGEILKKLGLPADKKIFLVLTEWAQDFTVFASGMRDIRMVETAVEAARGLGNECHVVLKPHPSGDIGLLRRLLENKKYENVSLIEGHLEELIMAADLCVSAYSTCILEAMFFETPSIVFDPSGPGGPDAECVPYAGMGAALKAKDLEEMASGMKALLFDPSLRAKIIAGQKGFIEYAAHGIDGKSAMRVSTLMESLVDGDLKKSLP